MRRVVLLTMVLFGSSCATYFVRSAMVKDGAAGCKVQCQVLGMELVGMVVMGEYSDGCICQVPGKKVDVPQAAAAGVEAAIVGVSLQQQRAAQKQTTTYGRAY